MSKKWADDGTMSGELTWVLLQAGDFKRAHAEGRSALFHARSNVLNAAAWYNLGRIAQARQDLTEAARCYRKALAVKPSKSISARLAGILGSQRAVETLTRTQGYKRCKPADSEKALCRCLIKVESSRTVAGSLVRIGTKLPLRCRTTKHRGARVWLTEVRGGDWSNASDTGEELKRGRVYYVVTRHSGFTHHSYLAIWVDPGARVGPQFCYEKLVVNDNKHKCLWSWRPSTKPKCAVRKYWERRASLDETRRLSLVMRIGRVRPWTLLGDFSL